MRKSEFWQKIWIPVRVRKPPPDKTRLVLIWNYSWKEPMIQQALVAWCGADAMERGNDISSDRLYSHWCFVNPPEGKK